MKKADIFMACDENYAPYAAAVIVSILQNTKEFINFHILDGGIINKSKETMLSLKDKFDNFDLDFHSMAKFRLSRFPDVKHYSINCFARYFIPELFPDIKKAIYIDSDTIVNSDIFELFDTDLQGYAIGAVSESFYDLNRENLIGFCPEFKSKNYFNSGVFLMDIEKLNAQNSVDKLVELTIKYQDVLCCPDQDVYNILFEDNYYRLPLKFNYMPPFRDSIIKKFKGKEVSDALENPCVIHYTAEKPWKDCNCAMSDYFWKALKETGFYKKVRTAYAQNHETRTYCLFNLIPLMTVKVQSAQNKTRFKLFGKINFMTKRDNVYYLFSKIPLFNLKITQ